MILRDFRKQDASEDELTVLLSFVEEDIYDHQRQSTAFPLLKVSIVKSISKLNFVVFSQILSFIESDACNMIELGVCTILLGHLGAQVCE